MKILLICVLYNSYEAFEKYIKSIENALFNSNGQVELDICVVDNSNEPIDIQNNYKNVRVRQIITHDNLGYFGGVKFAINSGNYRLSDYSYYIISNVDLIMDHTFFSELGKINLDKNIGCVAPSIWSDIEHGDRNPKMIDRTNAKKLKLLRIMYKFPLLHMFYEKAFYLRRRKKVQDQRETYIYAPHGSFMLFTSSFRTFLSVMNYPVFLFGEEIFIAENLRKNHLKTVYQPCLKIYDAEHVSTGTLKSKAYYRYNYEAVDMLLRRYFNE
ncbi:MAG: hypothetical protein HFH41_13335 [Lachnospiraceae bacterium]|nr:hypothetical protein [Lachnospiraceae bacterium]MCI8772198.1 hypothetical protein [Lachnospiraceae bacterium]